MTRRVEGFAEMASILNVASLRLRAAPELAAAITAPILVHTIKDIIGNSPPLEALAESTQDEREKLGYARNEPLKRTGELQNSYEGVAVGNIAAAGSNDPVAGYQEFGTARITTPRPAAQLGLSATAPIAHEILTKLVHAALLGEEY